MKNINSTHLEKTIKKNNRNLYVAIILFLGVVTLIYFGIKNENKKIPNPQDLNQIIISKNNKEGTYAYVDVATRPYLFAVYTTDGVEEDAKFYLVMDKEKKLYVLYMGKKNFNKLNIESIIENPIRVTGVTKRINNEIRDLAINSYNEVIEEELLTKENFYDYVGKMYLNMEQDVYDSSFYYIGAFLLGIFFITFITLFIVHSIKNRKTLTQFTKEEIDKIGIELCDSGNKPYEKIELYFLKDYVVDLTNYIVILRYQDILWAYPYEQRYNGIPVSRHIKVIDINNKTHLLAPGKGFSKVQDDVFQEILKKLHENNPNILLGFTQENRKIVKEKRKK